MNESPGRSLSIRLLRPVFVCWLTALMISAAGCSGGAETAAEPNPAVTPAASSEAGPRHVSSFDPELGLSQSWTGDLDGMIEREFIRALVVYNKTQYFIDRGKQRGVTYEALREFENFLNEKLGRRALRVHVVILPVERDE